MSSGADARSAAENTGHSPEVLWRTYTHEVEERLRRAAERMDEIITASKRGRKAQA
jgi:hypothetical protein